MKFQIADQNNGPFGEIFQCIEAAEKELAEVIAEGRRANIEAGQSAENADDFFLIVQHGFRVEFDVNPLELNWREAWSAAQKFSALKEGAGEASGSREECEQYREAFDEWLEQYQGVGKAALSVRIIEEVIEL